MAWVATTLVPSTAGPRPSRLRWTRWVFLAVAVALLGYVGFLLLDARIFQAYETWRLERAVSAASAASATASGDSPGPPRAAVPAALVPVDLTPAVSGSMLGRIEIARIGVDAIIVEGTSGRSLHRAVGHILGTAAPGQQGNIGIAGHRDSFFRALSSVVPGDEITLTTLRGAYHYRVETAKIVADSDVAVLKDSGIPGLTLVTCYPFYYVGPAPQRFVVRAGLK